jgi:hypothetical protein
MSDMELLAELIDDLKNDHAMIEPLGAKSLPGSQVRRQPIGVTLYTSGVPTPGSALEGKPLEAELWQTHGWQERTGYDPHGHGYGGWGVLTGYTWEEVQAIPTLSGGELLEYLDQTSAAVSALVRALDSEAARQPAPGLMGGRLTYYRWIKEFYKGFQAHVGEIVAIREMMLRSKDKIGQV